MRCLIHRRLRLTIVILFVFFVRNPGWGQGRSPDPFVMMFQSGVDRTAEVQSSPGSKIASFPCDPMMTPPQEAQVLALLNQPTSFAWESDLTIATLAHDLGSVVPVVIDTRSLEELGIDLNEQIQNGTQIWRPQSAVEINAPDASDLARPWWTRSVQIPNPVFGSPSLLVDITERLRTLDLEVLIRHGRVIITTSETAEEAEIVRLYDVTPLIGDADKVESNVTSHRPWQRQDHRYDQIVDTIETMVRPSMWARLGGESEISPITIRDRHWLAISTSTLVHLEIQRLLDRFNQDGSRRY